MAGQGGGEKAGCGPQRDDGEEGQGVGVEEAIDGQRCGRSAQGRAFPGKRWAPGLDRAPEGGNVETIKMPREKKNRRKGNENRRGGRHISFGV